MPHPHGAKSDGVTLIMDGDILCFLDSPLMAHVEGYVLWQAILPELLCQLVVPYSLIIWGLLPSGLLLLIFFTVVHHCVFFHFLMLLACGLLCCPCCVMSTNGTHGKGACSGGCQDWGCTLGCTHRCTRRGVSHIPCNGSHECSRLSEWFETYSRLASLLSINPRRCTVCRCTCICTCPAHHLLGLGSGRRTLQVCGMSCTCTQQSWLL